MKFSTEREALLKPLQAVIGVLAAIIAAFIAVAVILLVRRYNRHRQKQRKQPDTNQYSTTTRVEGNDDETNATYTGLQSTAQTREYLNITTNRGSADNQGQNIATETVAYEMVDVNVSTENATYVNA